MQFEIDNKKSSSWARDFKNQVQINKGRDFLFFKIHFFVFCKKKKLKNGDGHVYKVTKYYIIRKNRLQKVYFYFLFLQFTTLRRGTAYSDCFSNCLAFHILSRLASNTNHLWSFLPRRWFTSNMASTYSWHLPQLYCV